MTPAPARRPDDRFDRFLRRPDADGVLTVMALYTLLLGLDDDDANERWGVTVPSSGLMRLNVGSQHVFYVKRSEDLWIATLFVENGRVVRDALKRRRAAGRPLRFRTGGQVVAPNVDQLTIEAELLEAFEMLDEPAVVGAMSGLVERRTGMLWNRHWTHRHVTSAVLERRRELLVEDAAAS